MIFSSLRLLCLVYLCSHPFPHIRYSNIRYHYSQDQFRTSSSSYRNGLLLITAMTYRGRTPVTPWAKEELSTSALVSPLTIGARRNNAVPPGTVAARISLLQNLARSASAPSSPKPSSPRPDPRPLFSPGIGTTYRKPNNLLRERAMDKLMRDWEEARALPDADFPSRRRLTRHEDERDQIDGTPSPVSKRTSPGDDFDSDRPERNPLPSSPLSCSSNGSTKVTAGHRHPEPKDGLSLVTSRSSTATTSTDRRQSVCQLFNDYGIESPPELIPETASSLYDQSIEQTVKHVFCHSCAWLNNWEDSRCSHCNHRLCIDCDVLSTFLVSPKPSGDDDVILVQNEGYRMAEQSIQPSVECDVGSLPETEVYTPMIDDTAGSPTKSDPSTKTPDLIKRDGISLLNVMSDAALHNIMANIQQRSGPMEESPSLISAQQSPGRSELQKVHIELGRKPVEQPTEVTGVLSAAHTTSLPMGEYQSLPSNLTSQPLLVDVSHSLDRPPRRSTVGSSVIRNNPFMVADRSRSSTQQSRQPSRAITGQRYPTIRKERNSPGSAHANR